MVWAEGVSRGPVSQGKGSFSFLGLELGVSALSAVVMARVHRSMEIDRFGKKDIVTHPWEQRFYCDQM